MPFVLNEGKEVYFDRRAYNESGYLQVHYVFHDMKDKNKLNLVLVRFYHPKENIESPMVITASKLDKEDILAQQKGKEYIKIN